MSTIDSLRHEQLGWVQCPMPFEIRGALHTRLPVYRLGEPITGEASISGQTGDVLIGGGSGEASALVFAVPEIFHMYTHWPPKDLAREPIVCHWSPDEAFIYCSGFRQLGWNPNGPSITSWLAEHLMAFLLRAYPDTYSPLVGTFAIKDLGSIFTSNDVVILNK